MPKRQQLLATRLDTGCAATREALAAGRIDADQAEVITRAVADFPAGLDPQLVESAEQRLLAEAEQYDAMLLARLADRILELVDPKGIDSRLGDQLSRQEAAWRRREFSIGYALDGMVTLRGRLPVEGAELLRAALDPLSKPRPADATGPDYRHPGQRRADALIELASRQLKAGELPESGGEKPHLVVTLDYSDLRDAIGAAHLDTGLPLSPSTVRRIACAAKIIPAVLSSTGEPLDLGRSVRLISGGLRRALVLRDRGCGAEALINLHGFAFPTPQWLPAAGEHRRRSRTHSLRQSQTRRQSQPPHLSGWIGWVCRSPKAANP